MLSCSLYQFQSCSNPIELDSEICCFNDILYKVMAFHNNDNYRVFQKDPSGNHEGVAILRVDEV